ncbi:hypothetical protein GGF32_007330 [Allomyces javanicus]|nr:hypothetical protein GGF32_007330 [Allomyces javanicus]
MNELNPLPVSTGEPLACSALDPKMHLHNSAREQFARTAQVTDNCAAAPGNRVPKLAAGTEQQLFVQDPEPFTAETAWIADVADDTTHVVDSGMPQRVTQPLNKAKKYTAHYENEYRVHDARDYTAYMYDSAVHHHHSSNTAVYAPAITRQSTSWDCGIVAAAVVGAVVAPLVIGAVAPAVAGALGFSAKGIVAHSVAAGMMSTMGGAATQAGSLVATMQAIGATGAVALSPAVSAVAAVVGASVASAAAKGSILAIDAAPAAVRDRVES